MGLLAVAAVVGIRAGIAVTWTMATVVAVVAVAWFLARVLVVRSLSLVVPGAPVLAVAAP